MASTLRLDLAQQSVGIGRDGAIALLASTRPPPAVEGLSIGVARMDRPAPHAGERHLDGDELLYLIAGRATLLLEREGGEERVELAAGGACVVPRGLWHRVVPHGEMTLLYATPGPRTERRPLPAGAAPTSSTA
jgi:mannose-6-phosphate isomerase-like protein (cupin superfamily)